MKNVAFRIFDSFHYSDTTTSRLPRFVLGNISSSIRLIAHYISDPAVLSRFMDNQKQTHLRTSAFIEICRFLAIFPEYRKLMLEEIKHFTSKSSYNRFTLYMFDFYLESINITASIPECHMNQLDSFYFSYISHSYFYWNARKNGQYFKAFIESFISAFFHNECYNEIKGLLRLYPLSSIIHKYYGDMLLNIDGKFDEYRKEILFSIALEKKQNLILDPLLHIMSMMNPKILQFCNHESHNFSASSSATNTINATRSENSLFMFTKSHKKDKKSKKSSIASKIIRSKRHIPFLHVFNYILTPLSIIIFIFFSAPMNTRTTNKEIKIVNSIDTIYRSFYSVASSIFIPFALADLDSFNDYNTQTCQSIFFSFPMLINQYYTESPIISYLANNGIIIALHEVNDIVMNPDDICNVIINISSKTEMRTIQNIKFIFEENNRFINYVNEYHDHTQLMYKYVYFVLYGSISIVAFLAIYFIIACFTMNMIMRKDQNAIDFLSSDRRLAPILQDPESREIFWNQLNGFDSSINFSDSSFHIESESDIDPFFSTNQTNSNYSISTSSLTPGQSNIRSVRSFSPNDNQSIEKQQISPSPMIESIDINEAQMSEKNSLNQIPKLTLSHASFSGSGINIKRPQRQNNSSQNKSSISSDNENSIITEFNLSLNTSISSSTVNIDLQANSTKNNNGSSGNLSLNQKEIDLNSISSFLDEKRKESKLYGFWSIMIILKPYIVLLFFTTLAYYPLSNHRDYVSRTINNSNSIETDFYNSLLLLNATLNQLATGQADIPLYKRINEEFEANRTLLSHLYLAEQCFQFNAIECFSVCSIVHQLIENNNNSLTTQFLEKYALHLFLTFSEEAMKNLFVLRNDSPFLSFLSAGPSFIVLVTLFSIVFIVFGFYRTKLLRKGLNSLFHFPSFESTNSQPSSPAKSKSSDVNDANVGINVDVNINIKNKNDDHAIISGTVPISSSSVKFPTNVIIITSVTETDEIYSISETCYQIINKKSSEMICRKVSKVFPVVKTTDGFEIRDHNGKKFISKSITIGKLTKTVLIEESKTESKNKTTNVIQKLINFMPNYFAKYFSEEFINTFHFNRCVLIFIRINPNVPQIDNFFTVINRLDQNFFNIDFIRSNGSILTCLCKELDDLEIILFLRDLISSTEENCKKQMNDFALKSVYIDLIEELNIDIVEGDVEPETQFEEKQFLDSEIMIYNVDEHCIGVSDKSLFVINRISKFIKQEKTFLDKTYHTIPFKVFTDEIIRKM